MNGALAIAAAAGALVALVSGLSVIAALLILTALGLAIVRD